MTFLLDPVPTGGSMYQEAVLGVLGRHNHQGLAVHGPAQVVHVDFFAEPRVARLISRASSS